MPAIPTPTLEEAIAEKLAAWRRRAKVRDLYDLYWYGQATFDESLVRRLLVLKAWHDTVDDKLGNAPFEPADLLDNFDTSRLPSEDIGLLTQPAEPQHWLNHMITRFSFLAALDGVEAQIAACSPRDRRLVSQTVAQLAALHEAAN